MKVKIPILLFFLSTLFLGVSFVAAENQVGAVASDFELKDIDGKTVHLTDFPGRPIILNFWASWCGPCKEEMPSFQQLSLQYPELIILAINTLDNEQSAKSFLKRRNIFLYALFDTDNNVAQIYGVRSLPTTVLIGKNFRIEERVIGAINWQAPKNQRDVENFIKRNINPKKGGKARGSTPERF